MNRKIFKRILTLVLSLSMVLGMGITSFAAPSDTDYSRARLSASDRAALKTIFDADWYKEAYPDVVACVGDSENALFTHFLTHGMWETRQPSKDFNVNAYFAAYKDLQDNLKDLSEGDLIKALFLHYAVIGKNTEKREYTTISKALQVVSEVPYIGSFHSEEVKGTQAGDVVASRNTFSGNLLNPRIKAIFDRFYSQVKTFVEDESNGLSFIITDGFMTPSVFFSGFDAFEGYTYCMDRYWDLGYLYRVVKYLTMTDNFHYENYYADCDGTLSVEEADAAGAELWHIFDDTREAVAEIWNECGLDMTSVYDSMSEIEDILVQSPFTDLREFVYLTNERSSGSSGVVLSMDEARIQFENRFGERYMYLNLLAYLIQLRLMDEF